MLEYVVNAIIFLGFFGVLLSGQREQRTARTERNTTVIFERLLSELYSLEEVVTYSCRIAHDELLHMALQRMTCKQLQISLRDVCSKSDTDLVSAIFHSIDLSSDVLKLDQCLHELYKNNLLVRDGCACNATMSRVVRTRFTKYMLCYEAEEDRLTAACLPDILASSEPCETFYLLLSISKYYGFDKQYYLLKELASGENCIPKYSREDVLFATSMNRKSMESAGEWWKVFVHIGEDFST